MLLFLIGPLGKSGIYTVFIMCCVGITCVSVETELLDGPDQRGHVLLVVGLVDLVSQSGALCGVHCAGPLQLILPNIYNFFQLGMVCDPL